MNRCSRIFRALPRAIAVAAGAAVFAAVLSLAASARAQAPASSVEFSADEATVEPDAGQLALDGNVRVRCGRYQLRANRLKVDSHDGAVDLEGPAEVLLCPCDDAPITLGFERARIDPPSDLVLYGPSARVGGTTVLWLPAFWIRTPDRVGLLPPRVAWRGRDGLLVGPGFHLPWRHPDGSLSVLQLYLSGYTSGGFELEPSLVTTGSFTRVRIDRARGSLYAVESEGASGDDRFAAMAWTVDVARGDRVRSGWIEVGRAARRFDELRSTIHLRAGHAILASGFEAAGLRSPHQRLSFGPTASVNAAGRLGSAAAWQLDSAARMLNDGAATTEFLRSEARTDAGSLVGPVKLGAALRTRSSAFVGAHASGSSIGASSSLRTSVPLARTYGSGASSWLHLVEPHLSGAVAGIRRSGDRLPVGEWPAPLQSGARWISQIGMRNSAGRPFDARGASVRFGGGALGSFDGASDVLPAAVSRVDFDLLAVGFASESAIVQTPRGYGVSSLSYLRVGDQGSSHARFSTASRSSIDAADARALAFDDEWAPASWLDREGTSLSPGGSLMLPRGFSLFGDSWWEVPGSAWIGASGGVAYRHPCGCVGAAFLVAQRVGRDGADAWLTLSLAP